MSKDLKVIDLYSGVGGLSLGTVRAGFNLIGAVEKEQRIIESHKVNFPSSLHVSQDVSTLVGKTLSAATHLGNSELAGMVGGPPCQGFSSIGQRNSDDNRNSLFIEFFSFSVRIRTCFFLGRECSRYSRSTVLKHKK